MFGQNPLRSAVNTPNQLAVEDLFYTIQGEGPYGGMPCLFIRLAGCNLACHFCDTQFETRAELPESLNQIMARILAFPPAQRELVVLTGGEPLRQNPILLIDALRITGTKIVQVETAGTLWPDDALIPLIDAGHVVLVCSPKTPKVHPKITALCHDWKYVVSAHDLDPDDGLPNRGTQVGNRGLIQKLYRAPKFPPNQTWISPCDVYDEAKNKANMEAARDSCLKYGYRLSLQGHKIIGVA